MLAVLQLFGCVDWAPSDLVVTFLLAGVAQTCRRRAKVELIAAAGGVPDAPPRQTPSRDGAPVTIFPFFVVGDLGRSLVMHLCDCQGRSC